MELTINNLIKMVLGAVVLVAVILGVYMIMQGEIFPFFNGMSFNDSVGGKEICEGMEDIGYIKDSYFYYESKKTRIYFNKGKVKRYDWGWYNPDDKIGEIDGNEIDIYENYKEDDYVKKYKMLNGALIGGKEICK